MAGEKQDFSDRSDALGPIKRIAGATQIGSDPSEGSGLRVKNRDMVHTGCRCHGSDWRITPAFDSWPPPVAFNSWPNPGVGGHESKAVTQCSPLIFSGADGGGRTHTPLRVPDFESSASANSATSAALRPGHSSSLVPGGDQIALPLGLRQRREDKPGAQTGL